MLSPDGRCKMFDASADGYVRGEGAGAVILKVLSRALLDRDRIHAVIRATAVNQDGRTSTITVPSREAQIAMLRQACARADLDPGRIDYVEAHGTGTPVGDPVEAEAIGAVFGARRSLANACIVGSIKTNIGHLEPAAGIAGLIKAALCVRNGEIPPNLHFNQPNPKIDFANLGIRVPRALTPWPNRDQSRISAVNSFGFGGTNACAIIEQPPEQQTETIPDRTPLDLSPILIPVSAASTKALATVCARLADRLDRNSSAFVDVVGTLSLRRSHLDHRLVAVASSAADASRALRTVAAGDASRAVISGRRSSGRRLAFVFSEQGSQWWGMGRDLLHRDALVREMLERCDRLLSQRCGWSILEQLMLPQERSRINETTIAQPAIFALQVALARRLAAWGIEPEVVIGHSIGEIAAAHFGGALSLPQAIEVVYHRSRLQEKSRLRGGMAAVGLPADRARIQLEKYDGQLEVAAINGPELVSIAGPRSLLDQFIAEVEREGDNVPCQLLRIDYAFHSSQMDPLTKELQASLGDLRAKALDVPLLSTVTGATVQGEELDADYWCRNMRQPVLFKQAVDQAIHAGIDTFIELGAHPSLTAPIRACLAAQNRDGLAITTLHRERRDSEAIAHAVASLHVNGIAVDWNAIAPRSWTFVELDGYPWEKQVHWAESEESRAARLDGPVHPLLGCRLSSAATIWQSDIDLNSPSYLQDHRIDGAAVFPAAGYVELMLAAARETVGSGPYEIEEIAFYEALLVSPDLSIELETSVDEARGIVRVLSRQRAADAPWILRATSRIRSWSVCEPLIEEWKPKWGEHDFIGICRKKGTRSARHSRASTRFGMRKVVRWGKSYCLR
jgi:acyl transferase domain-containing protein